MGKNQACAISPWSGLCIVSIMAKIKPLSSFVLQIFSTNCVPGAEIEEINKSYLLSVRNWEYTKQIGSYNIKGQFLKWSFLPKPELKLQNSLTWSYTPGGGHSEQLGKEKEGRRVCLHTA